jgi:hypothetical protein
MDSLPNELIELIGLNFDLVSAVMFSRTCWRNYNNIILHIDRLRISRRKVFDDINAIKYEVCKRENSYVDLYGDYCGVREIHGRTVCSIVSNTYNLINEFCDGPWGDSDLVIFSDNLKMKKTNHDITYSDISGDSDSDLDDYDDSTDIYCDLTDVPDKYKQVDIIYTNHAINNPRALGRDDVIGVDYSTLSSNPRKYNDVSVCSRPPKIINGELIWRGWYEKT